MDNEETITIHWMRHALSCGSILEILKNIGLDTKRTLSGSKISDYGKYDASKIADKKILDEDINDKVLIEVYNEDPSKRFVRANLSTYLFTTDATRIIITSNEKRTIETAIYSFGHLERVVIIPVPYIGAKSKNGDYPKLDELKTYFEKFFESEELKKYFRINNRTNKLSYNKIRWYFLDQAKLNKKDPVTEVSNSKFDKEILPQILLDYKPKNIVAISHTDFIVERMGNKCKNLKHLNHLEIVDESYNYQILNRDIKLLPPSKWECDVSKLNPMYHKSVKDIGADLYDKIKSRKLNNTFENCGYALSFAIKNPIKTGGFANE